LSGALPRAGPRLAANALLDGLADLRRKGRLEVGGERRELLDLGPRPVERCVDVARLRLSLRGGFPALSRTLPGAVIHCREDTVAPGWKPPGSSTSCRPS